MTAVPDSPQQKIVATVELLRRCTQLDVLPDWRIANGRLSITDLPSAFEQLPVVSLNSRGHIPWQRGRQVIWLTQKIIVPAGLYNYPLSGLSLRLSLSWWAESAEIYLNGKLT